jgi:hypothetical protein
LGLLLSTRRLRKLGLYTKADLPTNTFLNGSYLSPCMAVGTKKREIIMKNGRNRAPRPKTFKTQSAAINYAKEHGITNPVVESLSEHKFRIKA